MAAERRQFGIEGRTGSIDRRNGRTGPENRSGRGRNGGRSRGHTMHGVGPGDARLNHQIVGGRTRGVDVRPVESRPGERRRDFSAQGVEVSEIGRFGCRACGGGLDGDRQRLLFFNRLGDRLTGRQGDINDGLAALDGVLDRSQGTHVCAHVGCDRKDGAVVFRVCHRQAGVDPILRDRQLTVGRVQVLERNHGADVRIDAVSHFGCPFVFDIVRRHFGCRERSARDDWEQGRGQRSIGQAGAF